MNDLVSIVVPIYNKEDLIGRCVDSLIEQTHTNLDIILIDDGSTDGSFSICQNYEKIDKRVKAFHKQNGGLSDARNYGLSKATGKWVAFVDGDDFVEKDYIAEMFLHTNGVDLVVCNYYKFSDGKRTGNKSSYSSLRFESKESIYKSILIPLITLDNKRDDILIPVWNKLYRKQLIDDNHLAFDVNLPYAEDYMFNIYYFNVSESIKFIPIPLYDYDYSLPGTLSKVPISVNKLEKYHYIHLKVAELFPGIGNEALPFIMFHNCRHHIKLYARQNGIGGFNTFCKDVYNMDAFIEASKSNNVNGNLWNYTIPSFLRRKDQISLFVVWAYIYSIKNFIKFYIKKLVSH